MSGMIKNHIKTCGAHQLTLFLPSFSHSTCTTDCIDYYVFVGDEAYFFGGLIFTSCGE